MSDEHTLPVPRPGTGNASAVALALAVVVYPRYPVPDPGPNRVVPGTVALVLPGNPKLKDPPAIAAQTVTEGPFR